MASKDILIIGISGLAFILFLIIIFLVIIWCKQRRSTSAPTLGSSPATPQQPAASKPTGFSFKLPKIKMKFSGGLSQSAKTGEDNDGSSFIRTTFTKTVNRKFLNAAELPRDGKRKNFTVPDEVMELLNNGEVAAATVLMEQKTGLAADVFKHVVSKMHASNANPSGSTSLSFSLDGSKTVKVSAAVAGLIKRGELEAATKQLSQEANIPLVRAKSLIEVFSKSYMV